MQEYIVDIEVDINVVYKNIIQNIIQNNNGGQIVQVNNMRFDSVAITADPQTIVFKVNGVITPFINNQWVIAFPLCYDSSGAEVTPIINNRTASGFDISIGGVNGQVEYLAINNQ